MSLEDKYLWLSGYESDIPDGWKVAFGEDLCAEIQSVYDKMSDDEKKDFCILQIKEKYGSLRFYFTSNTKYFDELHEIIYKYEIMSEYVCIDCGKTATKFSIGWISPYCDDCANKLLEHNPNITFEDIV